ncbi:MAG: pilus assembly protein, partial [Selenomonadaceae bacterium]|nr:pilus assembly protein [Selenomonadaceae bacterium]
MIKQRGQSAVEFALMAPLVLFMILAAIYGGAMFIQFMNYSNEARRIARDIAVTDANARETLMQKYETAYTETDARVGMYAVTLTTQLMPVGSD